MKYKIQTTRTFDKSFVRCRKRGYEMEKLLEAVKILEEKGTLPQTYRPHKLVGNHAGEWEAHIASNWLLTWQQNDKELILLLLDTGTHSDIFG